MDDQYFARKPSSRRRPGWVEVSVRGMRLRIATDAGVFARGGLDRGTRLLAEALQVGPCELVLDLGCGSGILGIVAAKISEGGRAILTDVNERAVDLARTGLRTNGLANAEVRLGDLYDPVADLAFDHIVSNPPIRAGRSVTDRIVSEAPLHLLDGGSLWLVARTRQGAEALRHRMEQTFGNATVVARGGGYKVLRSVKEAPEG